MRQLTSFVLVLFVMISCSKSWEGYERVDSKFAGREYIMVKPKVTAQGNPWIWRPAFFGVDASVDIELLNRGFHVVYYDLTHLYGSPNAIALGNQFYDHVVKTENLSTKVTLEGFSRGGLFAFNWAAENTDKVACIYVDAPVCDLLSWPGRKNEKLWADMLKEWKVDDSMMDQFNENPLNKASIIGNARLPVIYVSGDNDLSVPYHDNMYKMHDSLVHYGSEVHSIIKHGAGHNPHSLVEPTEIVEFIISKNDSVMKIGN